LSEQASKEKSDPAYVVYIDEAGDDGIRSIRRQGKPGATEWFALGGLAVEKHVDEKLNSMLAAILSGINSKQRRDIHFNRLDHDRRMQVCEFIAAQEVRCFVAISNKLNIEGYTNERAAKAGGKNTFYNWMTRLLLERVTAHCSWHSHKKYGKPRKLRMEFSTRGGMNYEQMRAYLYKIKDQSRANNLYIDRGDLSWDVVDLDEIYYFDHGARAGLQLADIVASAFYQSLASSDGVMGKCCYAETLKPRMAADHNGVVYEYGLKLLPPGGVSRILPHQRGIFEFYGAPKLGGRPPVPLTTGRARSPSSG